MLVAYSSGAMLVRATLAQAASDAIQEAVCRRHARGVPVVGLDMHQYYWRPRAPDESDSICPGLVRAPARLNRQPSSHPFGGGHEAVARRILAEAAR
jgi:type IV secretory pathway VirJ component